MCKKYQGKHGGMFYSFQILVPYLMQSKDLGTDNYVELRVLRDIYSIASLTKS
jgi:hypothetical protein